MDENVHSLACPPPPFHWRVLCEETCLKHIMQQFQSHNLHLSLIDILFAIIRTKVLK